jgi:hypothetical protein
MTVCSEGCTPTTSRAYHYDHSHVKEMPDGMLLVLATGETLKLCFQEEVDT